jgi:hypothetical protein
MRTGVLSISIMSLTWLAAAAGGEAAARQYAHEGFEKPCELTRLWACSGSAAGFTQVTEGGGAEGSRGYIVLRVANADDFWAASALEQQRPRKRLDLRDTCTTLYLKQVEPISVAAGYEPHLFIASWHPTFGHSAWYVREPLVVGTDRWTYNHVHLLNDRRIWVNWLRGSSSELDPFLSRVGMIGVLYAKGAAVSGVQGTGALGIDEVRYGMAIERAFASDPKVTPPADARPASERAAQETLAGPPDGPWRRLFLDDEHIADQHGLRRVFHPALKYAGNPVVPKDKPWEGHGIYLHGTVLNDGGRLRMWYVLYTGGGYMNAYAESLDGLRWEKPSLGLCEFQGSRDNNLILSQEGVIALSLNLSITKRPWEADPSRRYIAFFNTFPQMPYHPAFALSPDGLHWTMEPEAPKGLWSGDELRVGYDPYQKRYVATCKTGQERRGRAVSLAVSPDGSEWEYLNDSKPVIYSETTGKAARQIYNMPVFPYQGLYVGIPNTFHAGWPDHDGPVPDSELGEGEEGTPATLDIELAWSRDLVTWSRPPAEGRAALIPFGRPGEFDCGCIMGVANAPVVVGDELWFYYGGWDNPHRSWASQASIGLATLRLDGFASMQAGDQEGWLLTKKEAFRRPEVLVNAKVRPGGSIVAELLGDGGKPLSGFTRADCRPFTGDSVRHRLTWRMRTFPEGKPRRDLRLRFLMRDAELYSYLPQ